MIQGKQLQVPRGGLVYEVDTELLQDMYTPSAKNVHEVDGMIATKPGLSDVGPQDISNRLYIYYDVNGDAEIKLRQGANDNIKLAQSILTAGASRTVNTIKLKLQNHGSITAGKLVFITIEADTAGAPSGTPLATSGNVLCSAISGTSGFVTFTLPAALTLASATTYWIVLQGDYTVSGTNYISWSIDSAGASYSDGHGSIFDSAWGTAGASSAFLFRLYRDTQVVMLCDTFKKKSGTAYLIMATLDRLFYLNSTEDAWVDLTGYSAANMFTGDEDDRFSADVFFASDTFMITNYVDHIKKWAMDTAVFATNLGGSPPRAKRLKVYKNTVFIFSIFDGGEDRPYRIAWSEAGDPENWAAVGTTAGYRDLIDNKDIGNGLFIVGDYLVVTKERSIYVGYGVTDPNVVFQFDLKISGMGPMAGDLVFTKGDKMFFVGWDNFYTYQAGSNITPFANQRIRREFYATADPAIIGRAFSFDVESEGEWHVLVGQVGDDFPTLEWVYNYFNDEFWRYEPTLAPFSCAGKKSQSHVPTIDDLVGTIDQQLWRIDDIAVSGFNDLNVFGTPTGFVYRTDPTVGEEDGSGVEAYIDTKDYYFVDSNNKRVVGKFNYFEFKAFGTKCYIKYSLDEGVTWINLKAAGFDLQPTYKVHRYRFRVQANQLRFRIYKSAVGESFKLRLMGFGVQPGGRIFSNN